MNVNQSFWHALGVGLALFAAVMVNDYTCFDQNGWLVITTFLCCQTTRGTPLRQGLMICLMVVVAILMACLLAFLHLKLLTYIVLGLIFIGSAYLFKPLLIFTLVLVVAVPGLEQITINHYLLSIVTGAVIGIGFNRFFFSIRLNQSFLQGVNPLLTSLKQYSASLTENLTGKKEQSLLAEKKLQVEKSMLFQYSQYPSWVYETGFNPGLRSGWRYFLIHLERVIEIYFSLDFLAQRRIDLTLLAEFISLSMTKNAELIEVLLQYIENKKNINVQSDFTSDLTALEDALRRVIPSQIELLDVSPDYISLTALVKDIRDLRSALLQLVMSLPATH